MPTFQEVMGLLNQAAENARTATDRNQAAARDQADGDLRAKLAQQIQAGAPDNEVMSTIVQQPNDKGMDLYMNYKAKLAENAAKPKTAKPLAPPEVISALPIGQVYKDQALKATDPEQQALILKAGHEAVGTNVSQATLNEKQKAELEREQNNLEKSRKLFNDAVSDPVKKAMSDADALAVSHGLPDDTAQGYYSKLMDFTKKNVGRVTDMELKLVDPNTSAKNWTEFTNYFRDNPLAPVTQQQRDGLNKLLMAKHDGLLSENQSRAAQEFSTALNTHKERLFKNGKMDDVVASQLGKYGLQAVKDADGNYVAKPRPGMKAPAPPAMEFTGDYAAAASKAAGIQDPTLQAKALKILRGAQLKSKDQVPPDVTQFLENAAQSGGQ